MSELTVLNVKGVKEGFPSWDKRSIDQIFSETSPDSFQQMLF